MLNPSFEEAGASPGEAAHWTLLTFTSKEKIAGFGPVPYRPHEDFERWFDVLTNLEYVAIGFFDPLLEGYEDFDEAWDNDIYLTELPTGHLEAAVFDGDPVEDMEYSWSNAPYAWNWTEVSSTIGVFDGESHENFEDGWQSNEAYAWSWTSVSSEACRFDDWITPIEDFENDWPSATTI
jgi:hypothetical protein